MVSFSADGSMAHLRDIQSRNKTQLLLLLDFFSWHPQDSSDQQLILISVSLTRHGPYHIAAIEIQRCQDNPSRFHKSCRSMTTVGSCSRGVRGTEHWKAQDIKLALPADAIICIGQCTMSSVYRGRGRQSAALVESTTTLAKSYASYAVLQPFSARCIMLH